MSNGYITIRPILLVSAKYFYGVVIAFDMNCTCLKNQRHSTITALAQAQYGCPVHGAIKPLPNKQHDPSNLFKTSFDKAMIFVPGAIFPDWRDMSAQRIDSLGLLDNMDNVPERLYFKIHTAEDEVPRYVVVERRYGREGVSANTNVYIIEDDSAAEILTQVKREDVDATLEFVIKVPDNVLMDMPMLWLQKFTEEAKKRCSAIQQCFDTRSIQLLFSNNKEYLKFLEDFPWILGQVDPPWVSKST